MDSTDQDLDANVPDFVDAFDVVVDFDSQANPQDNVHTDNVIPHPVVETLLVKPGVGDTSAAVTGPAPTAPVGVRRSTREHKQAKQYEPSMTGKKYVFAAMALATTELGQSYLYNDSYQNDAEVAYAFMQQLSLKAALKQWGTVAEDAGVKEVSQLHWRDTFVPRNHSNLTDEQKKKVLESHMFVVKKRDGKTNARMVAGGNTQRDYFTKEDLSSPTVSTNAVLLTYISSIHMKGETSL